MNLYFVYDRPSRQWFTAGRKFYNEVMCEKMTNPNFKLNASMKKSLLYWKKRQWLYYRYSRSKKKDR